MSTHPTPAPTPSAPAAPAKLAAPPPRSKLASFLGYILVGRRRPGEVVVVSHSNLFYWWPVWLVGFILAVVTEVHGVRAGFVSGHPKVAKVKEIESDKVVEAIVTDTPDDPQHDPFPKTKIAGESVHFFPWMDNRKGPGIFYATVLILVIIITNVPLRGLWSLIVIIVIVLGSIILALAGIWEHILTHSRLLAIHINMATYLFISTVLFIVWLVNFLFFDRQHYVAVTPGQVRLKLMIGEGEIVYDTTGMVFQKQRSDLFRHYILGMGSGDLIIRPAGGKDAIDLPNVLFVGHKVRAIQELIKEKEIVAG
jgi:hypothetical protein